jgi:group I intron endonuclease
MNIICGIYKITSPSKKIYIGQSIDVNKRWNHHYKKLHCKHQNFLYHSLIKYGVEKHKFEVIHECLPEELNKLEEYYIELFQCFNSKFGLNLKRGGKSNGSWSDESKLKLSNSQKEAWKTRNRTHSKRTIEKMKGRIPWNKGKTGVYSQDTINSIKKSLTGKKHSENTLIKMRNRKQTEKTKIQIGLSVRETYRKRSKNANT